MKSPSPGHKTMQDNIPEIPLEIPEPDVTRIYVNRLGQVFYVNCFYVELPNGLTIVQVMDDWTKDDDAMPEFSKYMREVDDRPEIPRIIIEQGDLIGCYLVDIKDIGKGKRFTMVE